MQANGRKAIPLYVAAIVALAAVGVWLGSTLGRHQADAAAESNRAERQAFMEKTMREIEVGKPFPDATVWSADGSQAYRIAELTPTGGLIVYVSIGCPRCIDAVEALNQARQSAGPQAPPVIVVTAGDPAGLAGALDNRDITIPIYQDTEDAFTRRFGVTTTPTCFLLDGRGVVTKVATAVESSTDFAEMMSN